MRGWFWVEGLWSVSEQAARKGIGVEEQEAKGTDTELGLGWRLGSHACTTAHPNSCQIQAPSGQKNDGRQ